MKDHPSGWVLQEDGSWAPPAGALKDPSQSRIQVPEIIQRTTIKDGQLLVYDATGILRVVIGKDPSSSDYDVKMYDSSGTNAVTLSTLFFGMDADVIETFETTVSTTFTDLATVGPTSSVTVGASGRVWLMGGAFTYVSATNATAEVGLSIDGAAPGALGEAALEHNFGGSGGASVSFGRLVTGLSAGAHTFRLKYKTSSGAISVGYEQRWIVAQPF